MLRNQGQYCDVVVYQYIAMIRHLFIPVVTRQAVIRYALQWLIFSTLLSGSHVNDLYEPEDPF